ncbi:MAG: 5-carboxymethyl-2-hydroxymuconate Delta-isomerase [Gammaproteobacteria bacterium]|nr:5-carboxymethyl-2-hydroxymuconate Delta-isomerase [Gammaproteobacteria bacterium]MXW49700.1 5-carboxymethyl-2-hydroxymuconate Delta-isomerase [Gammaproteobacteria bacterium]MXX29433.1 5-carboxymethyl-2-hydroxymuconate Delta-isomerase [Gammaproteobacteria bacterium]MYE53492.1 5-carboxymethyl-2-hydroxymuconate Delta-isomerase [Gammaproteobacteria bacterium]MYF48919.1 5-carboxymethyl-2-hydroxymuconate Delta-isomerase [Gammaproteobacteria bacterium]
MPHLIVEYSANLESRLELEALMAKLRDVAVAGGVFPLAGIRVRAARRDRYLIADGNPAHGFVHVMARIGEGRAEAVRHAQAQALFDALRAHLEPLRSDQVGGLALSLEMVEIDPVGSLKLNNLHERLSG